MEVVGRGRILQVVQGDCDESDSPTIRSDAVEGALRDGAPDEAVLLSVCARVRARADSPPRLIVFSEGFKGMCLPTAWLPRAS